VADPPDFLRCAPPPLRFFIILRPVEGLLSSTCRPNLSGLVEPHLSRVVIIIIIIISVGAGASIIIYYKYLYINCYCAVYIVIVIMGWRRPNSFVSSNSICRGTSIRVSYWPIATITHSRIGPIIIVLLYCTLGSYITIIIIIVVDRDYCLPGYVSDGKSLYFLCRTIKTKVEQRHACITLFRVGPLCDRTRWRRRLGLLSGRQLYYYIVVIIFMSSQ